MDVCKSSRSPWAVSKRGRWFAFSIAQIVCPDDAQVKNSVDNVSSKGVGRCLRCHLRAGSSSKGVGLQGCLQDLNHLSGIKELGAVLCSLLLSREQDKASVGWAILFYDPVT